MRAGGLLLVSKRAAPDVFYLPGGKPEPDETPEQTLRREVAEELGATVTRSRPLAVISAPAAIEGVPMEMEVLLMTLEGTPRPRAEIARVAWLRLDAPRSYTVAPAIEKLLPLLRPDTMRGAAA